MFCSFQFLVLSTQLILLFLQDGSRVNPCFKDCVLPNLLGNGSKCVHDLFKNAMLAGGMRSYSCCLKIISGFFISLIVFYILTKAIGLSLVLILIQRLPMSGKLTVKSMHLWRSLAQGFWLLNHFQQNLQDVSAFTAKTVLR